MYDVQYVTISKCRLGVEKTNKNVINTRKGSVLWSSVMNSSSPWRGARCTGENGEKHHVHSALNSFFVAERRVGSRYMGGVINFIKCHYWKKK